jgi:hypothetical protein
LVAFNRRPTLRTTTLRGLPQRTITEEECEVGHPCCTVKDRTSTQKKTGNSHEDH